MIDRYLSRVEQTEAGHLAASQSNLLPAPGAGREEDWFGRWLDLLATTCPGPLTEAYKGTSLDLDILPRRRGGGDGA